MIILLSLYYLIHIFQLDGYKISKIFIYMKKKKIKILLRILIFILTLLGINYIYLVAALINIWPRYIHKKLVITNRVKRLFLSSIIFSFLLLSFYKYIIIFPEIILIFSSIINLPIEKIINNKYINKAKKKKYNGTVIAITGSYGKTSTKNFIKAVLDKKYNCLATPKSYNTPLGISKIINNYLNDLYDFFIVEMGVSKKNDMDELLDIITPDYSVITNIGNQHLKTFKTKENIYKEKVKILNNKTNIAFVNSNINISEKYLAFGNNSNIYASNINLDKGLKFTINFMNKKYDIETLITGRHNVENILCAFLVGYYFNVEVNDIIDAINNLEMVDSRLKIKSIDNNLIIDDSFNSNLSGAINALEVLSKEKGIKIIITPGYVELGKDNLENVRKLADKINEVCDVKIIIKNKLLYKYINDGIYFNNFKKAFKYYSNIKGEKSLLIENDLPDNY